MLKGNLIYLSPLKENDSETLFKWINDRELILFSAPYQPTHQFCHMEWFKTIQTQPNCTIFGVRRVSDEQLVGTCQLHSIHAIHRSAELQIRIGVENAKGQGIGKEACQLLLQHAFCDLNLNRIFLHVFENNERAIRLYTRLGFRLEGTLRHSVFINGQWRNVLLMAILRNEYLLT